MSEPVTSLADRLKSRRAELGISQAQAARELDVARTAYRLWEMEAAKPSPDRWRLIARWLGVSVTTMLLAEEMLTESEASLSGTVGGDFGVPTPAPDATSSTPQPALGGTTSDFFTEARGLLDEALREAHVSPAEADEFASVLHRLQSTSASAATAGWEPAEFRRQLTSSARAPSAARDAVGFVASGIASDTVEHAKLLVSELVTNSVQHAQAGPNDTIGLSIAVTRSVIRVEVSDASPTSARPIAATESGGYGLTLLAALASRWGAGRQGGRNVTWFELDVPAPGS
jgi:transcriptional regulator with XRE-family HTH domain/anti-sigma regulatory factor (Ser/Thr protein kinase)